MTPFGDYGIAMDRKVQMAAYHLAQLRDLLPSPPDQDGFPPIVAQAHIEGSGRCLASVPDQLAAGLVECLRDRMPCLPKPNAAYLDRLAGPLPSGWELTAIIKATTSDPMYWGLRKWRNRSVHRYDKKRSVDGQWILVGEDGDPFADQNVLDYLERALDWTAALVDAAPQIEAAADAGLASLG